MKKRYASILLTLIGALGLGVAAKAQTRSEIVVTLPFEFVVGGKTLPAGTYTLTRLSDDAVDGLVLRSYENRTSVIVHAFETEQATSQKPNVSFQRVGEQHFLNRIQTTDTVYNIVVSGSGLLEAGAQSRESSQASGNSGNN